MNVRIPDADGTHRLGVQQPQPGDLFAMRLEYDGPRDAFVLTVSDGIGPAHSAVLDDATVAALRAQVTETPKAQHPDMQVQVTAVRYTMLGSEGAMMGSAAQEYDPTETVESLILRVLRLREPYMRHDPTDHLILRVVEGTEPKPPKTVTGAAQGIF